MPAVTPAGGGLRGGKLAFSVDDGRGGVAQATVSITVGEAANQPPTADTQTLATAYETALPITLTGLDLTWTR